MNIKGLFVGDTSSTFVQFFRYCFVGGLAFVVDYGLMVLLEKGTGMHAVVAATISFVVGLAANYILSTFWIFKKSKIDNKLAEFLIFAVIGVIGLLINAGIIWFFQDYLSQIITVGWLPKENYFMVGKLLSTVIVFLWNFFARKIILFK